MVINKEYGGLQFMQSYISVKLFCNDAKCIHTLLQSPLYITKVKYKYMTKSLHFIDIEKGKIFK